MENFMKIDIKTIPAHIAYCAEYDVSSMKELIDPNTDKNVFFELQYLMEKENPHVTVPEIGDDYNYVEYPFTVNEDGTYHIVYYDMVDKKGNDNPDGVYRFIEANETMVACAEHVGSSDTIDETFAALYDRIEKKGYRITGAGRSIAVHGPWDRENECDYVNECQVPIEI